MKSSFFLYIASLVCPFNIFYVNFTSPNCIVSRQHDRCTASSPEQNFPMTAPPPLPKHCRFLNLSSHQSDFSLCTKLQVKVFLCFRQILWYMTLMSLFTLNSAAILMFVLSLLRSLSPWFRFHLTQVSFS